MINLLEGTPGAGKSYEAVVYHILPALKAGRKVITNLPLKLDVFKVLFPEYVPLIEVRTTTMPILGRWDAEAAGRGEHAFVLGEFDIATEQTKTEEGHPAVQVIETSFDQHGREYLPPPKCPLFQSVWDFYTEWRGSGGIGPLFVIDECHVSFPKPKRSNPKGTPDEVIEWFKLSRHFGADVLLMTQRMGALEEDIAGLAEFHIRVRKAAFLGKDDCYIRRVFAGFRGGEVSNDERQYMPQYFPLYKSHTQGQTVIEARDKDVKPAHLKWQRMAHACFLLAGIGVCWIGYKIFIADSPKPQIAAMQEIPLVSKSSPAAKTASAPEPASQVKPEPVQPPVAVAEAVQPDTQKLGDPLELRSVHMTGCIERVRDGRTVCTFVVSQNGMPVFVVTSDELREIGYEYKTLGHCAGVLVWKGGQPRPVICDAPAVGLRVAGFS